MTATMNRRRRAHGGKNRRDNTAYHQAIARVGCLILQLREACDAMLALDPDGYTPEPVPAAIPASMREMEEQDRRWKWHEFRRDVEPLRWLLKIVGDHVAGDLLGGIEGHALDHLGKDDLPPVVLERLAEHERWVRLAVSEHGQKRTVRA